MNERILNIFTKVLVGFQVVFASFFGVMAILIYIAITLGI